MAARKGSGPRHTSRPPVPRNRAPPRPKGKRCPDDGGPLKHFPGAAKTYGYESDYYCPRCELYVVPRGNSPPRPARPRPPPARARPRPAAPPRAANPRPSPRPGPSPGHRPQPQGGGAGADQYLVDVNDDVDSLDELWGEVSRFMGRCGEPDGIYGALVLLLSGEDMIPLEGGAYGMQLNLAVPHGNTYQEEEMVVNYGKMETFGKTGEHLRLGLRDMQGKQLDNLRPSDLTRTILTRRNLQKGLIDLENITDFLDELDNEHLHRPQFATTKERLEEARQYLAELIGKLRRLAEAEQRL